MKWLLLIAVTFLLSVASVRADYEDGLAALQRGDYAVAHDEFLRLAKEGHVTAQYNLGFLYDYGEGVKQDHNEAAKWYRMAAEQGLARAQFSLGIMYESGTGVPRDLARSYKWYSVAAETDAPGMARDIALESRDLIATRLSRDQLAAARKMIASFWAASPPESTGESSDTTLAKGKPATTEQGAAEAPEGGAITSESGRYKSALAALQSRDFVTAYREFLPLANQSHAHAQYTVGYLHAFGRGVEQDYGVAIKWYRMAAEQGLPEAQIALGIMYESGAGVPRDLNESHRRYSLAVENLTPSKTRDTAIEQRDRVAKLLSQEQLAIEQLNTAPTEIALSNNKVPENAPTGTLVGTVGARDPDAGDSLLYSLTGDAGGHFVIDPDSGALSVAEGAELDFETAASFELTVTATDDGGLTDSATVTISLDDVNEAPGDLAMTGGRVPENAPIGTLVGTVGAHDPDAGDSLAYALAEDGGERFVIDAKSGALSVAEGAALDFETAASFELLVTATDGGGLTGRATVTVRLDDVNEAPSVWEQSFILDETAPAMTQVGTITARDPDAGDSLIYVLTEDSGARFAIDATSGTLSVAEGADLDFEVAAQHRLSVRVTDMSGLSREANVTVSLNNVNEAPSNPAMTGGRVAETATAGTLVATLSARDPDAGDRLIYGLTEDAGGRFVIDPDSGALRVAEGAELDFEVAAQYRLRVQVADASGLSRDAIIFVSLDDVNEAPRVQEQTFALDETAPAMTHIGTVRAHDPDAGDKLVFALTEDADARFAIDPDSGNLRVAEGAEIDFEVAARHRLTVRATDTSGLSHEANVTVNIDDVNEAPGDLVMTGGRVPENAPTGALVGTVGGQDPDAGDSLLYSVTEGAGGHFVIDPDSGTLTVAEGAKLDFETAASFELTVTATDDGGLTGSTTVTVNLDDVNEAPGDLAMTGGRVPENAAAGTLVGTVGARDPDAGDSLAYTLAEDGGGRFVIDAKSGVLSVAEGAELDFETGANFELTVIATDGGGLTGRATVTVGLDDVNEAPKVRENSFTLDETAPAMTQVGTISARDPDAGDNLVYGLTEDGGGRFVIDPVSGALRVAEGANLDFEAGASFELTVTATDGGGLTGSATVIVSLDDVNEAPRVREQTFALDEMAPAMTHIGTVSAHDVDGEGNGALRYEITGGNRSGRFAIDPDSGALNVTEGAELDFETAAQHRLTVRVADVSGLSREAIMTVSLNDVNEAPSDLALTGGRVAENAAAGTRVGTVGAHDPDAGDSLIYGLTEDADGRFVIDPDSGALSVAEGAKLDFETAASFELTVITTDRGGLTDSATVTVRLDDVNEAPGDLAMTGGRVTETSPAGTHAGTVSAQDPDAGDSLVYTLTEDAGGRFAIDPDNGALSVAEGAELDFETATQHRLIVRVTDAGGLSREATVTVRLDDVNEAPRVREQNFALGETAPPGTLVGTVVASDPDSDANGALSYAIIGGNRSGRFSIDPASGALSVAEGARLDFEVAVRHRLAVRVTDASGLSHEAIMTVELDDVNEAPGDLIMTGGRVTENAPSGVHVGTISARDPDAGDSLIYALTDDGGGRFAIDPDSGALSVAEGARLDFEAVAHHRLVVRVTDSGGLTHEAEVTVSISDMNEAPRVRRQSFDLEETALAGTYVGTVSARDPDGDVNGVMSYAIDGSNSDGYFTIDPDSGALYVAQAARLDSEASPSFRLAVTVTDGGGLAGSATVTVDLKEVELATWRDEERVALIQEQLSRAGLDPGPIDGKMGPRTRAAIETYRQSHDGNTTQPSDREAAYYLEARGHFMFAFNYEKLGNYDDAIREYSQTIKLRPAYRNVYLNRGLIFHKMGLYDRAIADYNMAIELDPDNERAFYNRARANYQAGFYSRAMLDFLNTAITWL